MRFWRSHVDHAESHYFQDYYLVKMLEFQKLLFCTPFLNVHFVHLSSVFSICVCFRYASLLFRISDKLCQFAESRFLKISRLVLCLLEEQKQILLSS